MIKDFKQNQGFSLIEMIVSLGIFAIVMTTAVGSLLVVISTNQQIQSEQSVMTNLSFALDSMTREMRMGYAYFCADVNNKNGSVGGGFGKIFSDDGDDHDTMDDKVSPGDANDDCLTASTQNYRGVSFIEGGHSITQSAHRIMYFYDGSNDPDTKGKIYRKVGNSPAQSIVSSGIKITDARFFVTGSETLTKSGTDNKQPTITIQLEAQKENDDSKTYYLQTTITQRTLDI
jgi:prepilin-type N-terminal cleavage/methylation domain-containing protein